MNVTARVRSLPLLLRRTLALALLALFAAAGWLLIVAPLNALVSSQTAWRERIRSDIAENRGLLAQSQQLEAMQEALSASPLVANLLVGDAQGANLQLQEDLRTALRQSGVEPTTFKVLADSAHQALRVHRVEFASILTVDQLQVFFQALEAQPHYVRIERLQLSASGAQRSDENPPLNVLMEAHGYSVADATPTQVAHAN